MLETILVVATALSLVLHLPWVQAKIKASKTKADDFLVDGVDAVKDSLKKN